MNERETPSATWNLLGESMRDALTVGKRELRFPDTMLRLLSGIQPSTIQRMNDQQLRRFSISLTQFLFGFVILVGILVALGLNQNQATLDAVKSSEATVEQMLSAEMTVAAELTATLDYSTGSNSVETFIRENGQVLPGEVRVVPMATQLPPEPTATPLPTPDPAHNAEEWMMWWYLLTDNEPPNRPVATAPPPDS